jgi:[ribosomal protein S5]-alanine N-acetyltransferase
VNHAAVPTLAGERCVLRALVLADAPAIARHANDPTVALNLHDGFPQPYTLEVAEAWCGAEHRLPQFGHVWAIDTGGEAIGCVGVVPGTGRLACNAEVGYWIGPAHWGRGIAAEALGLVSAWAWVALPAVQRLFAPIYERNSASQRVATKAGYVLEARLPRSLIKAGEVIDVIQYAAYRT